MSFINWFYVTPARPAFVKLMQDLDFTKYYAQCDLRGDLEEIQKVRRSDAPSESWRRIAKRRGCSLLCDIMCFPVRGTPCVAF